jgi:hypothetical protein
MTPKQRVRLQADLWPKACEAQGWDSSDRAKKLEVIGKILGHTITTTNEILTNDDFDLVKRELGYLADNVQSTKETLNPAEGRARRLREQIQDQVKCLGLYHPNPRGYLQTIVYDKFSKLGWGAGIDTLTADPIFRPNSEGVMKEGPSQLDQIVMAMGRGIQMRRKAAGDSVHTMKIKAGVPCDCSQCRVTRVRNQPTETTSDPF